MAHALGALGRVVDRVAAGDGRRRDPRPATRSRSASALWACDHGMASLEAPHARRSASDVFDWDVIAPLAIDALLRGLATDA